MTFEKPPIYEEANKIFKLEESNQAAIFTYGDTLYNPFRIQLTTELIRHEETHMEQQEAHPDIAKTWWKRYIQDSQFRLEQEAEAYGAQYNLYCQQHKDKNSRFRYLFEIAGHLSSPMYGSIITRSEAQKLIKDAAEGVYNMKDE